MKSYIVLLILILVFTFLFACSSKQPSNVILIIGDGAGFNHLEVASCYIYGTKDSLTSQSFPVQLACTTFPATGHGYDSQKAWSDFDYVMQKYTDSAASGTALACGVKTYNGAIGVDQKKKALVNLLEQAKLSGKMTGVVTTVPFSHATPAAFVAHNEDRHHYHEIAGEMILESAVDVIMGAGHPFFDHNGERLTEPNYRYISKSLWDTLNSRGPDKENPPHKWTLIQTRTDFQKLMNGPAPDRVFGLAQVASTLQEGRSGQGQTEAFQYPMTETVPNLEEMARAAINILDDDPDGFVLMIEAGAIDWASHENNSVRLIEELVDMEETVKAVVNWIETESSWNNTLLVVTADHETGYITGPESDRGEAVWNPVVNNGKGHIPGFEWHSGNHTNSLVPLQAKGKGSKNFNLVADKSDSVYGNYLDNTDVGLILKALVAN